MSTSVYVHSNAANADLSVSASMIDEAVGVEDKNSFYVSATIQKLQNIQQQLDSAAEAFLDGYSPEGAQENAKNAGNLLVQLANEVLYGSDAYEMVSALTQNKRVDAKKMRAALESQTGPLANEIINNLKGNMSTGELASILVKYFVGDSTVVEVDEAGGHIRELGALLNVNTIKTSLRQEGEQALTDKIFKTAKPLVTKKTGAYRNMIKDLLESSNVLTVQQYGQAVNNFCEKLKRKMIELAPKYVHFISSGNPNELENRINIFIERLKPNLLDALKAKANKEMHSRSNVAGMIGEEVRSSISKTANSVIISFVMGDLTEEQGVDQINQALKSRGITNGITEMKSHHQDDKQSLTDLVLLNTNNKQVIRAQSKNHFAEYFTKERADGSPIENFRWMVSNNLNVLSFIQGLSKTELGINLNEFDFSNIAGAMANNIWFQYHDSAFPKHKVGGIDFASATVEDFKTELEGSLERLLAGQITNFLGVSVISNTSNIESSASNIFYLLNGRLKKTADLVGQAIKQLQTSENLKLNQDKGRMVIVNLDIGGAKGISPGTKSNSFLVYKLRAKDNQGALVSIGEQMGRKILDNIKINVSLGTSIDALSKTALIM